MSNLRDKAIEIAKQTSSESAFMCGYDLAVKEYEEKLRWIHVEDDLPSRLGAFHLNEFSIPVSIKCEEIVSYGFYHFTTGKLESEVSDHEHYEFTHWRSIL